jgi:sulfatase modifying factor 1
MKAIPIFCFTAMLAFGFIPNVCAQTPSAILTLEQSVDGLGSWQRIPLTAEMIKDGDIDVSIVSSSAFYRMRISLPPPSLQMVFVQGGTLETSNELNGTVVSSFLIGKYEVTWKDWQEVIAWAVNNGYTDLINRGSGSAGNHPVRGLSWYDAVKWCNALSEKTGLQPVYTVNGTIYRQGEFAHGGSGIVLVNRGANGYRLPIEAEWEWAARGGSSSQGYRYSGSNDLDSVSWSWQNSGGAQVNLYHGHGTWPVGLKLPNELGIFDMSGNVWEWCEDLHPYARSIRGGSWAENGFGASDILFGHGVSDRETENPNTMDFLGDFGMRIARNAP